MAGISGLGITLAAGGALVIYASVTDQEILAALKTVAKGEKPHPVSTGTTVTPSAVPGSSARAVNEGNFRGDSELAHAARSYLGRPYMWGGNFAGTSGGDCSGLVYRCFHDIGYDTPRWTSWNYGAMHNLFAQDPNGSGAGDLIWYPGHIAIAVDSTTMIEAPTFGVPVRVAPIRAAGIPLTPQWNALAKYRTVHGSVPNAI